MFPAAQPDTARDVFSVSRLNAEVRDLLGATFPHIWVEGELSNLARPASGHLYFTLKDARAQVRCALFRNRNRGLGFVPEDGMQVLVRAEVSLYEARGDYQLIVDRMEAAGDGALRRAFEALKQRLAAEGLFDEASKRPLPPLPRRIGVVTSPSGAAIRDILSVLRRRFPAVPVLIYPVPVQGEGAAGRIAAAIRLADQRRDCDVLILARGGGSLEDLWAFNEEVVARAIHAARIPVVSGVGHEVDVTIADFAADRRAPTPSAAAELVVPDRDEWLARLESLESRLTRLTRQRLADAGQRLEWLAQRLQQRHPGARLRQQAQRLDELELRLQRTLRQRLHRAGQRLATLEARLHRHDPAPRLQAAQQRCHSLEGRLQRALRQTLERAGQRLATAARQLETVSPLATLERGYAIVTGPEGRILHDAREVAAGDAVEARLARGRLRCTVDAVLEDGDEC
ncbi:exodeoxyribonuclease VII large subunit [Thiohalobacter sp. IOR34]|uniref:exodeoxyribonuclease VII large subunit n=1 Tax=Thiohalobacter sp. IOR34 TaxID=3057176 RepID=UPI0025B0C2D2|nr:exodeoxyribonuclease VII large subunit [Thiohalobacter sp. IOR34]WJW76273.1 exodeoxyribonuclease VII large subunit [Thiohalobacter sp. IOR34]